MSDKTIKVNPKIHKKVDDHTQSIGGKIGKFFEIAAQEKLDREGIPTLERQTFSVKKETKA